MTAEGDNRVLMVKIVKDMMTNIASKKSSLPQLQFCPKNQLATFSDISTLEILFDLLKYRETTHYANLVSSMH